jgi:hypothetical protein
MYQVVREEHDFQVPTAMEKKSLGEYEQSQGLKWDCLRSVVFIFGQNLDTVS